MKRVWHLPVTVMLMLAAPGCSPSLESHEPETIVRRIAAPKSAESQRAIRIAKQALSERGILAGHITLNVSPNEEAWVVMAEKSTKLDRAGRSGFQMIGA